MEERKKNKTLSAVRHVVFGTHTGDYINTSEVYISVDVDTGTSH